MGYMGYMESRTRGFFEQEGAKERRGKESANGGEVDAKVQRTPLGGFKRQCVSTRININRNEVL